nr:PREDICTED: breast cancer type 2 susceptibility protein isoform X1 [Latimeria chalumnae]XP_014349573.1 PREDICTED: breast cancer type 2 susceptibility protein isoform X1 [Latimeria chalumnae]|eukprot:XP_014349572.1 PREDICTED: breast cancer type 2 susceptibility protein isoform X1 [Latimeria chalumnae]
MATKPGRRLNLFETFRTQCSADLGPLSPNWFEELTLQAPQYNPKESDDEVQCLNENCFKTPKQQQPSLHIALASTPAVFKDQCLMLPPAFTPEREIIQSVADSKVYSCQFKETPCILKTRAYQLSEDCGPFVNTTLNESSAVLKNIYGTPQRKDNYDYYNSLFCTPKLPRTTKHISESLGAETDPDMSWSSSLATPPSLTPTVIICGDYGKDDPYDKSLFVNKPEVAVSGLFCDNAVVVKESIINTQLGLKEDENSVVWLDGKKSINESKETSDNSVDESDCCEDGKQNDTSTPWKLNLPEVLKDGEVHETVSNVLDGAEDVLSVFFTNNKHSGLRKVKSINRSRKKHSSKIGTVQEHSNLERSQLEFKNLIKMPDCFSCDSIKQVIPRNQNLEVDQQLVDENITREVWSSSSSEWSQLNISELDAARLEQMSTDTFSLSKLPDIRVTNERLAASSDAEAKICFGCSAVKDNRLLNGEQHFKDGEEKNSSNEPQEHLNAVEFHSSGGVVVHNRMAQEVNFPIISLQERKIVSHKYDETVQEGSSLPDGGAVSERIQYEGSNWGKSACMQPIQEHLMSNPDVASVQTTNKMMSTNCQRNIESTSTLELKSSCVRSVLKKHQKKFLYSVQGSSLQQQQISAVQKNLQNRPLQSNASTVSSTYNKCSLPVSNSGSWTVHTTEKQEPRCMTVENMLQEESIISCKALKEQELGTNILSQQSISNCKPSGCSSANIKKHFATPLKGRPNAGIRCRVLSKEFLTATKHLHLESVDFSVEHEAQFQKEGCIPTVACSDQTPGSILESAVKGEQTKSITDSSVELPVKTSSVYKKTTCLERKAKCGEEHIDKCGTSVVLDNVMTDFNQYKKDTIITFQTASNKAIHITDDALQRAKNMFTDVEEISTVAQAFEIPIPGHRLSKEKYCTDLPTGTFTDAQCSKFSNSSCQDSDTKEGFCTAYDKESTISSSVLEKAKLLKKVELDIIKEVGPKQSTYSKQGYKTKHKQNISESTQEACAAPEEADGVHNRKQHLVLDKHLGGGTESESEEGKVSKNRTEAHLLSSSGCDIESYNFCGFKTASNKNIKVSAESVNKGKLLFKEISLCVEKDLCIEDFSAAEKKCEVEYNDHNHVVDEENECETKPSYNCTDLHTNHLESENVVSNLPLATSKETDQISSPQKSTEVLMTESQKAELAELTSILEEAGSQFEFTQFRENLPVAQNIHENAAELSSNENLDSLNNISDMWKDVDFDDSFETEVQFLNPRLLEEQMKLNDESKTNERDTLDNLNTEASKVVAEHSDQFGTDSEWKNANKVVKSITEGSSNVCISMNKGLNNFLSFGGFCLASGKKINSPEDILQKAAALFSDIDGVEMHLDPESVTTAVSDETNISSLQITNPSHVAKRNDKCQQFTCKNNGNSSFVKSNSSPPNEKKNETGDVKDNGQINSFQTTSGKRLCVFKEAMEQARALFNEDVCDKNLSFYKTENKDTSTDVHDCVQENGNEDNAELNYDLHFDNQPLLESKDHWKPAAVYDDETVSMETYPLKTLSGRSEELWNPMLLKQDLFNKAEDIVTVQGKKVSVSKASLQKATTLFADKDIEDLNTWSCSTDANRLISSNTVVKQKASFIKPSNVMPNKAFEQEQLSFTPVVEQDAPLRKELSLKETVPKNSENSQSSFDHDAHAKNTMVKTENRIVGFQTASGKKVTVTKDSLAKVKVLFAEDNVSSEIEKNQSNCVSGRSEMPILKKDEHPPINFQKQELKAFANKDTKYCKNLQFQNFQTASGQKFCAAKEWMDKNKSVIDAHNENKQNVKNLTNKIKLLNELQTSNGLNKIQSETLDISQTGKLVASVQDNYTFGFSTVSGNQVSVSETSLLNAKKLFADVDLENKPQNEHVTGNFPNPSTERRKKAMSKFHSLCSLSSDGDVDIKGEKLFSISKQPLEQAKEVLCKMSAAPPEENFIQPSKEGCNVNISNTFLTKNKSLSLKDVEETTTVLPLAKSLKLCTTNSKNMLNLNKPEEETSRLKGTDSEMVTVSQDFKTVKKQPFAGTAEPQVQRSTGTSIAFSTANGKPVNISHESLKKARKLLSELDTCNALFKTDLPLDLDVAKGRGDSESIKNNLNVPNTHQFGFSTTSGKTVCIDEKALKHAKKMFIGSEMVDEHLCVQASGGKAFNEQELNNLERQSHVHISAVQHGAFSTASGKAVDISDQSLKKARTLFAEMDHQGLETLESAPSYKSPNEELLHGDKAGDVPKEAAASNRKDDEYKVISPLDKNVSIKSSFGFSTASGRQSKISRFHKLACQSLMCTNSDTSVPAKNQVALLTDFRARKRMRLEQVSADEPPVKRQLLAEFDRTVENGHKSLQKPLICTPNGTLKDRRKFMYSVPLKPVVCGPWSNNSKTGQQVTKPSITLPGRGVETFQPKNHIAPSPVYDPPSNRRGPVFAPPFHGATFRGLQKPSASHTSSKTAKTFVPPFKMKASASHTAQCISERTESLSAHQDSNEFDKKKQTTEKDSMDKTKSFSHTKECSDQQPDTKGDRKDHASGLEEMTANLQCARDLQEMRLRKKQRQNIRPQPGSLYLAKTSGVARVSLKAATGNQCPSSYSTEQLYVHGVGKSTLKVRSENAESFQFSCSDYFGKDVLLAGNGLKLADGGWLIPSDKGMVGKEEFYRALCDTPGVAPKLISESWVYNHYRWIVWKLAAMEAAFPKEFGNRCLTPERVLLQLKYRYDIEVDKCRRSTVKKIMERDDTAAKTLVLCISKLISVEAKTTPYCKSFSDRFKQTKNKNEKGAEEARKEAVAGVIETTDGWYGIKVLLDPPLTVLVQRGRLSVGCKIITHGAEIIGSQDACTPLEAPECLMLKISANSTRPACWSAKLGFHRDPRPFPLPLASLFNDGGLVGCVDVVVVRLYPIQWMEKKSDGIFVFRNDRAEEREAQRQVENQQRKMESLFAKIQTEFEQKYEAKSKRRGQKAQKFSKQEIQALQDGAELNEAIENSMDPGYFEACLREEQLKVLHGHRQMLNEKKQAEFQAEFKKALESAEQEGKSCCKRGVTPVWKLRIVDYRKPSAAEYILNIWRPLADLHSLLKEGNRYRIYQLLASQSKGRTTTADIQLTATKKTQYQQFQSFPELISELYSPRKAVKFNMLMDPTFRPAYAEVDLVGYTISIEGKPGVAPVVYLSDESHNFVAIKVWTALNQLAVEDIVKPFSLIAASNLQWRSDSRSIIPMLYAGDLSIFSSNPKEGHLQEAFNQRRTAIQDSKKFYSAAGQILSILIGTSDQDRLQPSRELSTEPQTPTWKLDLVRNNTLLPSPYPESKHTSPLITMKAGVKSMTFPGSAKLMPQASENQELDTPKNRKKKAALDYLCRIPSPPALTPIRSFVSSSLQKAFHPPRSCVKLQSGENPVVPTVGNNAVLGIQSKKDEGPAAFNEEDSVADEELAMINTQAFLVGLRRDKRPSLLDKTASLKGHVPSERFLEEKLLSVLKEQASSNSERNATSLENKSCDKSRTCVKPCEHSNDSIAEETSEIIPGCHGGESAVENQSKNSSLCHKKLQQKKRRKYY